MTVLEPAQKIEPKFDDQNGRTRFASRHQSHRAMTADPEDPHRWSFKGCLSKVRTWTRFLLVGITLLCLTSTWSNILAFNFVMVCTQGEAAKAASTNMDNDTDGIPIYTNGPSPPVHFTTSQRTYMTSAVAVAALIANFIVTPAMAKFGTRTVFTVCGGFSIIATAFMPLGLRSGFAASLVLRALQGVAFAASFPAIGAVSSRWTYYKQYGLCVSSLVAYIQLSPTLSMPISGALCESTLGWPSVFYGHAVVCAAFFVAFALLYRNNPDKHPLVTRRESTKISINKARQSKKDERTIPYKAILKTPAVWAVWIASLGNFICVNTVFLYSPSYFHGALGMAVAESGLSSALPAFLEFILKICCGFVSDKLHCIGETNRLRFFNSIAYFGAAIVLAILCFIPASNHMLCFTLLSIATALLGFTTGGFFKAGPIVARQYSPFVTGNVSLGLTLTMIFVPFVKNGLAPQDTPEQWRKVFWFMTGSLISTNIIFCLFCSGEPAEWTKETPTTSKRHKTAKIVPLEEVNPADYYCDEPVPHPPTSTSISTITPRAASINPV